MTTNTAQRRAVERLERLAGAGLDDTALRLEALQVIMRALPVDGWAWATADPSSQLAVSALADHPLESRMLGLLQAEEDPREVNRRATMITSRRPVAALSATTGGQLHRSVRWREHMAEQNIGDELRIVFADRTGCWSYLDLYTYGQRHFIDDDLAFAQAAVRLLTGPLRRAPVPRPGEAFPGVLREPAVLVLGADLQLRAKTGPADQWLPLLRTAVGDPFPCAVLAATARVLATHGDQPAMARQRAADGQWATVRAAPLDSGDIAVTIDHSRPGEVLGYLARAAGLTDRERQVLALLHQGYNTRATANQLVIAETTVLDHVKNILAKTGHTSRRALLASLSSPLPTE